MIRPADRATLLAAALLGLTLGACGGTLYDPDKIPVVIPGGLVCTAPAHACADACVAQSVGACGAACTVCPAAPANGSMACQAGAGTGGDYGCVSSCDAGFIACSAGCCRPVAVAAGGSHACALLDDGSLACWGANDAGQLGPNATGASSTRPVLVPLTGVNQVAVGGHHTCALEGATLKCWGANDQGQLGRAGAGSATPSTVAVGGTPTALAAGARHSCAVVAGAVKCWGDGRLGQLGDGGTTSTGTPVTPVVGGATAVSALTDTTCAVVSGGAQCWGANGSGQVGNGASGVSVTAPHALTFPLGATTPVLDVYAGDDHACARLPADLSGGGGAKQNGGLFCWGANGLSQLGDAGTTPSTTPIRAGKIDNGGNAFAAAVGAAHSCAARDPANVVCSGQNAEGQAGSPPATLPPVTESPVSLGGNLVQAAAGLNHTCALVDLTPAPAPASTLVVKCWGRNAEGQLGRATASGAPDPSPALVGQ